jgi:uncharacterized protein YdaU (DUF1376 family)
VNYYYWHIGDYLSHTSHLDLIEDITYRRLLDLYYRQERPLENNIPELARLIRMRDHGEVIEAILREFFALEEAGWRQARCDQEINRTVDKSAKARASGQASGRARRKKGTDVERSLNERSTKVELPIPNTQYPIPKKEKKAPPFDVKQIVGLHIEIWEKWVAYRKELNKPLKPASFEAAAKELAKYGSQQAAVVQQSIAAGWQGLFPLKASQGPQGVVLQDPESLALRKLTERRAAIGLADFRLPNLGESSKDYRAAQDQAWAELKRGQSQKAPEIAVTATDQRRNLARLSDALKGW